MPITSSAKKALRSSKTKAVFNTRRSEAVKRIVKEIRDLVAKKKRSEAMALLPKAYKIIDKAAKMNFIKKNAASRKKSRLSDLIKKIA